MFRLQIAKRQAVVNPENTFFSVKRFIGRKMDEVKEESKQVPYQVRCTPEVLTSNSVFLKALKAITHHNCLSVATSGPSLLKKIANQPFPTHQPYTTTCAAPGQHNAAALPCYQMFNTFCVCCPVLCPCAAAGGGRQPQREDQVHQCRQGVLC